MTVSGLTGAQTQQSSLHAKLQEALGWLAQAQEVAHEVFEKLVGMSEQARTPAAVGSVPPPPEAIMSDAGRVVQSAGELVELLSKIHSFL